MRHVKCFDNGSFQIYMEDDELGFRAENVYFMFSEEYGFQIVDLVGLVDFLRGTALNPWSW